MNIVDVEIVRSIEEIELRDGIRMLNYSKDGYSYWYKGKEISQGSYDYNKWDKIRKKFQDKYKVARYDYYNTTPILEQLQIKEKFWNYLKGRKENKETNDLSI